MAVQARCVVVGGGVVGLGTLYHLARKGWDDCLLIERKELTSGSTWHAAGLLPLFNMSYSVGQIHKYSLKLYPELAEETGQDVGLRLVSNIRLARQQDRMDEYLYYAGIAKTIGVDVEFLTPEQIGEMWPYVNLEGLTGALHHPHDGYVQPADLAQAFAKGARSGGARIWRNTAVTAISQKSNGEWLLTTDKDEVTCEHLVLATGNFARNTGRMVGLEVPVIPVEHQYIVTEAHPGIVAHRKQGGRELCVLRESDSGWYMREENGGLILGPYEVGAPCCYMDGPDPSSEYELFQEDLDRLDPYIETAIQRVPAFGEVGVKQVYNGAIAYTPDGSPLVGPAWGKHNLWLNEGHSFGITAAGGAGWQLAEWIAEGEPTIDMMGVDPRRFGPYAGSRGYLKQKNEEAYRNVFTVHYPDEERAAGRPLKRSPCYDRMQALGAVFGSVYGWERPNWFAPEGYGFNESELSKPDLIMSENHAPADHTGKIREFWSFRRSNYFEHVGNECKHVHNSLGLLDMSAFAKIFIEGPGAAEWLESIFANKLPKRAGRLGLFHMLSANGGVRSEFTVYKMDEQRYYLVSAGAFTRHDQDYLWRLLPTGEKAGSVTLTPCTERYGVLVLAGPQARNCLQKLTDTDLGNKSFPWLSGQFISVGGCGLLAMRVNFVGELGWELHHPIEMQTTLFDLLMEAGAEFDIRPFGIRAMDSLRIEKSYRLIPREMSIEYSAYESALDRFIKPDKGAFLGREALLAWRERGFSNQFVTLEVLDIDDCDARGNEAIYMGDNLIGRATSGGFGWRVNKSLALAMVHPQHSALGTDMEIEILGKRHRATVVEESPFDPENLRLRA